MKIVDLVCPNCNGSIQLDEDKEFGFCMHCGHRIVLAGSDIGNNRYAQLKRLKTVLEVKSKGSNFKDAEELCDRIIELDPNDSDAWYYKGLYAMRRGIASEALPYWTKSIEGMSKEEAREMSETMADIIADTLLSGEEDNVPVLNLLSICQEMDEKLELDDNDDEDTNEFLAEILDKMIDKTQELKDSSTINFHVTVIVISSMCIVSHFGSVFHHKLLLAALVDDLSSIRNGMSRISVTDSWLVNRDREEVSRNISFLSRVISEIDHTLESYTEEELDKLSNYWIEQDMSDFMDYLLDARVADLELMDAGIMSISKYKNERSAKIQSYLDTYFEPLKKGLC